MMRREEESSDEDIQSTKTSKLRKGIAKNSGGKGASSKRNK
jgi:hypothetical protein